MELIEKILSEENFNEAIKKVKSNKGAPGIDKMTVKGIDEYFDEHKEGIKKSIMASEYKPQPVRRVYIPKANGKKRPLAETFVQLNQIIRGWINYFRIGSMKRFLDEFGQ